MGKGRFPHIGVADIKLFGQLAADLFRRTEQLVKVTFARRGYHPLGSEQEGEFFEQAVIAGQLLCIEPLVGVLVGTFEIEPCLPDRRYDDPVTGQIDRVAVALIDGRHLAAGKRPVKRIFRAFALQSDGELLATATKFAKHRIGIFSIDLDMLFTRDGRAFLVVNRSRVAKQLTENVGQEVMKDFLLFIFICFPGTDQLGPFQEFRAGGVGSLGQVKRHKVRT